MAIRFTCDRCRSLGYVRPLRGDCFPNPCGACGGKGRISLFRLSKILGVNRTTLRRVHDGKIGPRAAERVFIACVKKSFWFSETL